MKVPLSTQTKYVNAIITLKEHKDVSSVINDLKSWCNTECELYAFIVHDKDMVDDKLKSLHIHLCMLLKSNKKRLSTTINDISGATGVGSLAISIEKMNDVNGSIQYLIHKNDKEKYQYSIDDIITNLNSDELSLYMSSENGQLSTDRLLAIIWDCRFSRIEIMKKIGLGYYHLYRNVINDIIKEYSGL